jgi:hypothetical protein
MGTRHCWRGMVRETTRSTERFNVRGNRRFLHEIQCKRAAGLADHVARVEQLSDAELMRIAVGRLQTEVTRPLQPTKPLLPNPR